MIALRVDGVLLEEPVDLRLADVGLVGFEEEVLVLGHHRAEAEDLLDSPRVRPGGAGGVRGFELGVEDGNVCDVCGGGLAEIGRGRAVVAVLAEGGVEDCGEEAEGEEEDGDDEGEEDLEKVFEGGGEAKGRGGVVRERGGGVVKASGHAADLDVGVVD